jgi:hypothetical protein
MKTKKVHTDGRSIQCTTAEDFESGTAHMGCVYRGYYCRQRGIIVAEDNRKKEAVRIYGDVAQVS